MYLGYFFLVETWVPVFAILRIRVKRRLTDLLLSIFIARGDGEGSKKGFVALMHPIEKTHGHISPASSS